MSSPQVPEAPLDGWRIVFRGPAVQADIHAATLEAAGLEIRVLEDGYGLGALGIEWSVVCAPSEQADLATWLLGNSPAAPGAAPEEAARVWSRTADAAHQLGLAKPEAHALCNRGLAEVALGDVVGAIDSWRKSERIARAHDWPDALADVVLCIGTQEHASGQLDRADISLNEALSLADGLEDNGRRALILAAQARLRTAQDRWSEAETLLREAISLLTGLGRDQAAGELTDELDHMLDGD